MKLTIINGNGGNDYDVAVHRAGCRDIAKSIRGHNHWTEEHESKFALWENYNSDFMEEGGAWPIHFHPCTKGLPEGGEYNV